MNNKWRTFAETYRTHWPYYLHLFAIFYIWNTETEIYTYWEYVSALCRKRSWHNGEKKHPKQKIDKIELYYCYCFGIFMKWFVAQECHKMFRNGTTIFLKMSMSLHLNDRVTPNQMKHICNQETHFVKICRNSILNKFYFFFSFKCESLSLN